MQSIEAVQIDHARPGYRDRWPEPIIPGVAMRDDNVQSVSGSSLEDNDQNLTPGVCLSRGAREPCRRGPDAKHRDR